MTQAEEFVRCAELLDESEGLLITAGAGMGVDAGLPDFRGTQGFWRAYPALAKSGIHFEDIASPDTFETDPELAWGFYGHRLNLYRRTDPHEGHRILSKWAAWLPQGAFVFTSNVDGLFQKAGFSNVVECHGSIHRVQCLSPCSPAIWPADYIQPIVDEEHCRLVSPLLTCPDCGALVRPNILMFGDWNWQAQIAKAQQVKLEQWLEKTKRVLVIELGAGTNIPTVRNFSQWPGMPLIRINPAEPELGNAKGVSLKMGAAEALCEIDRVLSVT
jgi:NAD-dependent SIR2 family protein deacetylase